MIIALSTPEAFTLALVGIFFVGFPLLIGALVLLATIQAWGERRRYEESRRHTPLEPPHHLT